VRPRSVLLRLATLGGCLVLLALAWPGWLHGSPNDPQRTRRVAWGARPDPLLEKMARRLDELLDTGKLAHGFNVTPETAHYLAWFGGARARTFFDTRFALFGTVAEDYGRARKALREEAGG